MTASGRKSLVVVGGGITGLSAALALSQMAPEAEVTLLESSDRLGGKLHTETFHGVQVETGADSFLTRDDGPIRLCADIGIEDELTSPAVFKGAVWDGNRCYGLPSGAVMGIPTNWRAVWGAEALSPFGRLRAAADLFLPGSLEGGDVSVGQLIKRRFGREVLERLVDPLLAGTRAGDPGEMSLAASLPQVDAAARSGASVMKGLSAQVSEPHARPLFMAPKGGMSRMIERLAARLSGRVRTGAPVTGLARRGDEYALTHSDSEELRADGVILAIPAPAAAELAGGLNAEAATELRAFPHASVAVIALAYSPGALPLDGESSGFLVPSGAGKTLSAASWWSLKWPHTGLRDVFVVRCFVGRAGRDPALDLEDGALAEAAAADIGSVLDSSAQPLGWKVTRWRDGLPQYEVGHLDRVARIERSLARFPGIALAGADYRGSGIPDCIRQGRSAAALVHRTLTRGGGKVTA